MTIDIKHLYAWACLGVAVIIALVLVLFQVSDYKNYEDSLSMGILIKSKGKLQPRKALNDWKTYRNEQYGFEIKIPQDWQVKPQNSGLSFLSAKTREEQMQNQKNCTQENGYKNCISDGVPPEIFFDNSGFVPTGVVKGSIKTITVNNAEWTTYVTLGMVETPGYDILYRGKHFTFLLLKFNIFDFEGMLSTFKFINSAEPKLIGGDKDAGGCLIGAGYSWCEVKKKCLRVWEEKCE